MFDPRIDAARGDLADLRQADRIFAPHYAAAAARTLAHRAPLTASVGGKAISEVLQGEDFEVLEFSAGYAWGISPIDGTVGFVDAGALIAPQSVTHIVCAPGVDGLPMGTRLADISGIDGDTVRPLDAPVADYVALAEALIGVPALSGGRSGAGVNCTGLVFLTLSLAGIRAPRFADLQAESLGHSVAADAPLLRGDLLYFDDHAAIAADGDDAIHVHGGAVVREPVAAIAGYGPLVARRRLP